MKLKDKVKWAKEIAKYENIIKHSSDKQEINDAERKMLEIIERIERIEPFAMIEIDELIPQYLK